VGVIQRGDVYDNGPQLSYAASRHSGLTVLGPYKSENVFQELNKPWSIISITLWYSIKQLFLLDIYEMLPKLSENLNIPRKP